MEGQRNSSFVNNNERQDLVKCLTEMVERAVFPENSRLQDQCIYRVPQRLRQLNPEAYAPRVVSIGPFHSPSCPGGDHRLKPMEDLKLQYLKSFLEFSQVSVGECVSKLKEWETNLRHCYAEPIQHNSNDFLKMVLIDAGFIIELFIRCYSSDDWKERDPLLLKPRLLDDVFLDLTLLENQIPFFVLTGLYNLAIARRMTVNHDPLPSSFVDVTFDCFDGLNEQKVQPEGVHVVQHFTHLLRTFMLPPSVERELSQRRRAATNEHLQLHSASQLLGAGLDFKVSPRDSLLDLKFHKGVLELPCLKVNDNTETFIRNIIAFEQCHLPFSPCIAEYMDLLDSLINVEKDVSILVDKKIIVNNMGDADAVAKMFNNICSNITLSSTKSGFCPLYEELNAFYENPRNKYKAIFIHEYFNTPWKIASTMAAVLLLLLTSIQTVCSIISLF